MDENIGLDVSLKETAVSIRRSGKRVWRGKCPSDPQLIATLIRKDAPQAKRVVFETGQLSVWFFHALIAEELPAICIDARHAKAALDMAANKTDANDADGLAHLAEVGFYNEVRVKSFDNMLARTLVAARTLCRSSSDANFINSPHFKPAHRRRSGGVSGRSGLPAPLSGGLHPRRRKGVEDPGFAGLRPAAARPRTSDAHPVMAKP